MDEHYSPLRNPSFIRRALEHMYREEAERAAWLAGVQKRLGLLTRQDVNDLIGARIDALGGVMWPS
jgi:hypothetical protein